MSNRMCVDCNIRRAHPSTPEGQMCLPCYDYAGRENEHTDDAHDEISLMIEAGTELPIWAKGIMTDDCPVCHPELDPRSDTPRTGHTNTRAHSWNSHTGHGHLRTPEARAACRKFMAAHNGMDEVTFRVAQREQELDDAYADDDFDLAAYVRDNGCMYHRDNIKFCDGTADYRVSGDVWCATALKAARRNTKIPAKSIVKL